jgi:thiamine phosphate synthase YjbQ (UPF0047 family)
VLVNTTHSTALVFTSDDERRLYHDYKEWLEDLAPMKLSTSTCTSELERTTPMTITSGR